MTKQLDYYAQQTKRVHEKFGLSEHVKNILKALDDVRIGHWEESELRRLIRNSPGHRRVIHGTIDLLADHIASKPKDAKDGSALIQLLNKALRIADMQDAVAERTLPFMKLPREVRDMIYRAYIKTSRLRGAGDTACYPRKKLTTCTCSWEAPLPTVEPYLPKKQAPDTSMALSQVSKGVHTEFMEIYTREKQFYFNCTCEMEYHLRNNSIMLEKVQSIKFHWCGPRAVEAFKLLRRCQDLRRLTVIPSIATTRHLTARQQFYSRFFTQANRVRLSDALGIDELVRIRGLDVVAAISIAGRTAQKRTQEELANLRDLLNVTLLKPKPSDYHDENVESENHGSNTP